MTPRAERQRPGGSPRLKPNPEELDVGDREPEKPSTAEPAKSSTPVVPKTRTPDGRAEKPKYLRLESKDTRLRSDQLTELAQLRRRVMAARDDKTERITENTLIRLGIDLLLSRADDLEGDTEDELRASLGII
jgi:hypothetical protein